MVGRAQQAARSERTGSVFSHGWAGPCVAGAKDTHNDQVTGRRKHTCGVAWPRDAVALELPRERTVLRALKPKVPAMCAVVGALRTSCSSVPLRAVPLAACALTHATSVGHNSDTNNDDDGGHDNDDDETTSTCEAETWTCETSWPAHGQRRCWPWHGRELHSRWCKRWTEHPSQLSPPAGATRRGRPTTTLPCARAVTCRGGSESAGGCAHDKAKKVIVSRSGPYMATHTYGARRRARNRRLSQTAQTGRAARAVALPGGGVASVQLCAVAQ